MTYLELTDSVLARAFPERIAANLRPHYKKRVLDGLIELQRLVPYLKKRQFTLYPSTSSYYRQGTTVIDRPAGKVKRICVFQSRTLRDAVYYDPATRDDIDRMRAQKSRVVTYPEAHEDHFGYFAASEETNKGWRAERGYFCIEQDEITIYPHIESTERIMVEWSGSKTSYEDTDVVVFGKYEEQVLAALENFTRWKAAAKEDRSASDYQVFANEWREAVASLMLDTKEDTEPEIPLDDIGILPRTMMPTVEAVFNLGCAYNPVNAFFKKLWVMCLGNRKFYNFGALLLDGNVVEMIGDTGYGGGKAEATYETIRCAAINFYEDGSEQYFKLEPHVIDGNFTHGFNDAPVDIADARSCTNIAVVNVDVLADDNNYYRMNLDLQDGQVVIKTNAAPAEPEDDVPAPAICASGNTFVLKDVVTQKCMYVRIKDGQLSVSDS